MSRSVVATGSSPLSMVFDAGLLLVCEAALWGLYTGLALFAIYLLCARTRSRQNVIMLAVTVSMYALSSTHGVMALRSALRVVSDPNYINVHHASEISDAYTLMLLCGASYLLGDTVVIWRLYILFDRSLLPCVLPFIFLLAAVGSLVIAGTKQSVDFFPFAPRSDAPLHPWMVAFNTLSLVATLSSTLMIGLKTRLHMHSVVPYLGNSTTGTRILVFMLESGALYCLLWCVTQIACLILFLSRSSTYILVVSASAQVIGIFPTAILIAAAVFLDRQPAVPSLIGGGSATSSLAASSCPATHSSLPTTSDTERVFEVALAGLETEKRSARYVYGPSGEQDVCQLCRRNVSHTDQKEELGLG